MDNKIIEIEIDKISPDPNQPRKIIDEEQLGELAENLRHNYETGAAHKMINPIEIDENNIIVTGEQRWRAAKLDNWETVPVKIVNPGNADDRFLRQVKENAGRGNMNDMDMARALGKVRDNVSTSRHADKYNPTRDEFVRATAEMVGAKKDYVHDMLALLEESEEIQKAIEQNADIGYTLIREANRAPEEFRNRLKAKVMDGTLRDQRGVSHLAHVLSFREDKADELLADDYSGMSSKDILSLIDDIAPTPINQVTDRMKRVNRITKSADKLVEDLSAIDLKEVSPVQIIQINSSLTLLDSAIKKFFVTGRTHGKLLKEGD